MSNTNAFLRDICENPKDDTPRLVFADWLEDNGNPDRAEFIRAQVRLSKIRQAIPPVDEESFQFNFGLSRSSGAWHCPGDSPERRDLAFRCRWLLATHEEQWLAPPRMLLPHEWAWSRGFIEVVDADPGLLETSADDLFGLNPLRRLILTRMRGKVGVLALVPKNNYLTALDLILGDIDLNALRALVKFRHLRGLKEVNLAFNNLRDSAIDFLCGEPFFQDLSLLSLCGNPFTYNGRQRLREHFGSRVSFERTRHPDRIFAFAPDPLQAGPGLTRIQSNWMGTAYIHTGWGSDKVQLLLEEQAHDDTMTVFDHAGDLLHVETRSCWDKPESQRRQEKLAWLQSLGYQSATIHVKRFPGVYDFPKSWSDVFECSDAEPEDYAAAVAFMEHWLAEDQFRYGSFCGGWWFNRTSGQRIAP